MARLPLPGLLRLVRLLRLVPPRGRPSDRLAAELEGRRLALEVPLWPAFGLL
jgi:hypothetical protein